MQAVRSILRKSARKDNESINILCMPTHERYETHLANTGHNFYAIQGKNIKSWNVRYSPVPKNYFLMSGGSVPPWVDIDLVFSQNKFGQYELAKQAANILQVPLVTLEHTLPIPNISSASQQYLRSMSGDIDVFISEYSVEKWGWSLNDENVRVVRHGLDTGYFKPNDKKERSDLVCSVVNDWIGRDIFCGFRLWQQITKWPNSDLPLNVWGDTEGLSVSAKDTDSLIKEYQRSSIFLNTSLISPVPTVLLEAMSCGCAVVSTNNCMIPEFITHGENGLLGNTAEELRSHIDLLRKDANLRNKLGENARKTIVEKFNLDRFTKEWDKIFRSVLND